MNVVDDDAQRSVGKAQRQHLVQRIIEGQEVTSQAQLVELLAAQGVHATQPTVSRDLEELGALKVRSPGAESRYAIPALPREQVAPLDHLRRILGEWVVEVVSSGVIAVVHTPPGCAHVVASALDRSGIREVVGTVAGDDTVMVVAPEEIGGKVLAERLSELAGLGGSDGDNGSQARRLGSDIPSSGGVDE